MQSIEIDFEVFKALTALRRSESHTYNQVIRDLLDLGTSHPAAFSGLEGMGEAIEKTMLGGFESRGLFLPNGTQLRATHKGKGYSASIRGGQWVAENGQKFTSPSAAASAITQNNVNGWRFWQAKRPSDSEWRNLDALA